MLLKEIFELVPKEEDSGVIHNNMGSNHGGERRGEVSWHQDAQQRASVFKLVSMDGKTIKGGLTAGEAKLMANRPDLIKRFGRLIIKQ